MVRSPALRDARSMSLVEHEHAPASLAVRLRLRLRRRAATLDRMLAEGANPLGDPLLGARAAQLAGRRTRDTLAAAIEQIVRNPRAPLPLIRSTGRVARSDEQAVRATEADLRALAARLRDPRPVDGRGVALTSVLLHDPHSPLYDSRSCLPLRYCVRMARLSLQP
jgi:hypothetical protein